MKFLANIKIFKPKDLSTGRLLKKISGHSLFFNMFEHYLHDPDDFNKYESLGYYAITVNLSVSSIEKMSPVKILKYNRYSNFTTAYINIDEYDRYYNNGTISKIKKALKIAITNYYKLDSHRQTILSELYRPSFIKIKEVLYKNDYDQNFLNATLDLFNSFNEDAKIEIVKETSNHTEFLRQELDFVQRRKIGGNLNEC